MIRKVGFWGVILLALGACSAFTQSAADRVVVGVPEGFREGSIAPEIASTASPRAGWVSDDEFGIVLLGSSSCPPTVTRLTVVSPDEMSFSVDSRQRGNCTDDAIPTTHIFQVPPEITQRPVRLVPKPPSEIDHIVLP